ncbi:MAG: hypothetical protein WHV44_16910, partial [Anaerolineales bacterium]
GNGGGGGGGGGSDFDFGNGDVPPQMREFVRAMEQFGIWLENNLWVIAVVVFLVCILWLVMIFLSTIGQIGVIKGAQMADDGAETLGFGEVWRASVPYFWRVLGLSLGFGLLVFLLVLLLLLPVIVLSIVTMGIGLLCLLPFLCVFVPLMWVLGVIINQSTVAIVVEDRGILDAVQRSWAVVRANIGQYILMALILFIGGGIVGLVIAIPVFIIVVPAILSLAISEGQNFTGLMIAGLCFVLYLPVAIILQGVLATYINTAWTLTFRRLTTPLPQADAWPEPNQPLDLSDAPV